MGNDLIALDRKARRELEQLLTDGNTAQKIAKRARIVLMTADGHGVVAIMREVGVSKTTVWRWQDYFAEAGVDGLIKGRSKPPGRKPLSAAMKLKVVERTVKERPANATHWSVRSMAEEMGISHTSVQRIWAEHGLKPHLVARQYREDIWQDQIWRPEVWIEKAALLGVVAPVCDEFRVPYFAHIGNNSQSEQYKAGQRFADLFDQGRIPLVLHLADHDPNGIDMTRDNAERLALYARQEVEVRRIALNIDQVRRYGPPPNFAKETDSRYAAYARQYGPSAGNWMR